MAFSGLAFACKPHFYLRPSLFNCIRKAGFSSVAAVEMLDDAESLINQNFNSVQGKVCELNRKKPEWRKLKAQDLGISTSMINKPTKKVLNGPKKKGYVVYLVGGSVRDLILN